MGAAIAKLVGGGAAVTVSITSTLLTKQFETIISNLQNIINAASPFYAQTFSLKSAVDAFTQSYKLNIDLTKSLDGVRGTLSNQGSLTLNLLEQLADFDAGIRVNVKELNDLNARMRLSNQDTALARKVFTDLAYNTAQSEDAIRTLSEDIVQTSKDRLISETRLLEGIQAISQPLKDQAFVAGTVPEIEQLAKDLTARTQVPVQELNRVLTVLLSNEQKYFTQRAVLGLGGLPEQISGAKDQEDRFNILINAVRQMVDKMTPYAGKGTFQDIQTLEAFGGIGMFADLKRLLQNLDRGPKSEYQPIPASGANDVFKGMQDVLEKNMSKFDFTILKEVIPAVKVVGDTVNKTVGEVVAGIVQLVDIGGNTLNWLKSAMPEFQPEVQKIGQNDNQQAANDAIAKARAEFKRSQEYEEFKSDLTKSSTKFKAEDFKKLLDFSIDNLQKEIRDIKKFPDQNNEIIKEFKETEIKKRNDEIEKLQRQKEYVTEATREGLISQEVIRKIDRNIELQSSNAESQKDLLAMMSILSAKFGRLIDRPEISRSVHGLGNTV